VFAIRTIANGKARVGLLDDAGHRRYGETGMRWFSTFGILLLLLAAGCQSNQNTQVLSPEKFAAATGAAAYSTVDTNATTGTNAKPRVIVPGVSISVTVDQDHSLDHVYAVPISGAIDFVPLGRVQVEGLTADEVAQKIKEGLEKDYFQKATVTVAIESALATGGGGAGGVIYVIGNVNRPGPLLLPKDEHFTVTKAIIAAGNFATFANGGKVQLIRYGKTGKKFVTYIDVDRIMKRGEFEKDIQVQDGDWIIVPEKLINF
jgi:protein involved in polysaccharide export with SLBB domain